MITATPGEERSVRERILDATHQALRELDVEQLLSSVGVRELAARAGASTSAVYHHVGSLDGLADSLERRVYTVGPVPTLVTLPGIQELTATDFPLHVALDMHAADISRLAGDPGLRARMWVWTLGGERARARYAEYLRTIDGRLSVITEALYSAWDREPRPPFDYLTLIALVAASTQGAALRQLVAPDPSLGEPHTRTLVAMSTAILRRRGDHRDLDAHLVALTYLPSGPERLQAAAPRSTAASRILFSAGELFRVQGFQDTTLAQVARRADVSLSTLHRWYDGKDAIALALLRSEARDLLPGPQAGATLQDYLQQVVEFARPRLRYLAPYVAALLTGALPDDDPLLAATVSLLPQPDLGVGRRLLMVLLQRLHHMPGRSAPTLADGALELLGLRASEAELPTTTW